ncbi:myosin-binding protein 1 isoform X2 [Jatropha curcas]|uniref:myosin-binding protein 1 isoform X2 n=1 Tax=Jatropha curcas TaxID=180498 RepID=UPI0009D69E74|nr:myosin-binding protein 1 isoform X2 [Jatropha curcas]
MAAKETSLDRVRKNLQGFMTILKYAACELLLTFLLLIDAVFSYLLTTFARHCKLQIPCILCSRLDHILGNEKPGFYCNLLCRNHRSEISYLFSCCIHGKLADGRGMCEECLLSFTMKTKSNTDMNRLLLGKFGFDLSTYGCQSPLQNKELGTGATGVRLCSCCNKPWRSRQQADKLFQLKSPRSGKTMPCIPLPRRLSRRESLKKIRERLSGSASPGHLGQPGLDGLSQVGYMELKFASDSESDFPFSDDEEGSSIIHEMTEPKEESKIQQTPGVSPKPRTSCVARDNFQEADQKAYQSAMPEHLSLADFPILSSRIEASVAISTEKREIKFPLSENLKNHSALPELMPLGYAPSSSNVVEGPPEAPQSDDTGTSYTRNVPINMHQEIMRSITATSGGGVKNDRVDNKVPPINPTYMNQSDSSKENEASGFAAEKSAMKEAERVNEDSKLSSIYRGITSTEGDELRTTNASRSNGVQILEETVPMERTESSSAESLDEGFVHEIEGESIVDQLKRQVECDKKCINALYKELEEERSASAIAANQAMAMITRLQEEKAALHMEALQYLRMMEEQAEYDVDALEKANDLLAEKEKEVQDLEAELEFFRLNFPEVDVNGPPGSISMEVSHDGENIIDVRSSWAEFEEEKLFLAECLKDLEEKFHQIAQQKASVHISKSNSEETVNKEDSLENEETEINGEMEENNNIKKASIDEEQGHKFSKKDKEIDLVALGNEISELNERLEALESDWNFVEHTFYSLLTGNKEGLKFVKEISHQLQELRKTVTEKALLSG